MNLRLMIAILLLAAACKDQSTATVQPVQVVSDFYYWYLGYPGSVMAEGAYHDSVALTDTLIGKMDDFVSQGARYDPFLCAQDFPDDFRVSPGETEDRINVETLWNVGTEFERVRPLQVDLLRIDGQWRINAIHCAPPASPDN